MIELVAGVTVQLGSAQYQHVQEFVANSGNNTVTVANTDADFIYLYGGAGNDTLTTGSGGGYLFGEGGTNMLTGGGGTNVFVADGASGIDTMNGGSGSNLYYIDANSIVHGAGTFNNVIELQQNASLALGSAQLGTDVQQVIFNGGTNSADFHTATSSVFLYGGAGNDTLFGGTGNDFLYGGARHQHVHIRSRLGQGHHRGLDRGNQQHHRPHRALQPRRARHHRPDADHHRRQRRHHLKPHRHQQHHAPGRRQRADGVEFSFRLM